MTNHYVATVPVKFTDTDGQECVFHAT
jgi:hypothetical protein